MAFEYYDEKKAESVFEATLTGWIGYGYKGCFSIEETRGKLCGAFSWAWTSKTARDLMYHVQTSDKKIIVVGMRGGFQCFGSGEGPDKKLPVVFIDLDGSLTVNVRDEHNLNWDPNECSSKGCKVEPLSNNIALLHEFGHAKQWIERPSMFENQSGAGATRNLTFTDSSRARKIGQVKTGSHDFDARLEKGTFAKAIREKAEKRFERSGKDSLSLPGVEEAAKWKPPVWNVAIEEDNMSRHEWPICMELGLPRRKNYRDINVMSTGEGSPTSQIALKARLKEEKERKEREEKAAELAKMPASVGSFTCKECGKAFLNKGGLFGHRMQTSHQTV